MISLSNLATDPGTMDEVRSSASWSRMLYYSISYAHVNWCSFQVLQTLVFEQAEEVEAFEGREEGNKA